MGEIALALILLVCAGLLIQTFARLGRVHTGLRTENLFTARVNLPDASYPRPANVIAFFDQLLAKLRAIPGVNSASIILPLPLTGSNITTDFDMEEHPLPEGQRNDAPMRITGLDYFETMGIPLLHGRVFKETDKFDSLPVVIVNERFAQKFFPGQNVVGKHIQPGWGVGNDKPKMREIVGVVGNVKHLSLQKDFTPEMYVPATQIPINLVFVVARTSLSDPGRPYHRRARSARLARSRCSAHSRSRFRRIHIANARQATLQRLAIIDLRRNCAASHGDWNLRRACLFRLATHKRNRNPDRTRRRAIEHFPVDRWPGDAAGRNQHGDRAARRIHGNAFPEQPALRRRRVGSDHFRFNCYAYCGRCVSRLLAPGPPGRAC